MRLMINAAGVLLLTLTLVQPASSMTDNPEAVAKAFLRAAYAHDAAQFNNLVFPRAGSSVLLSTEPVAKDRLEEIETETKSLRLKQLQPFRQRGEIVAPGSGAAYPDGSTTRYQTAFEGNLT